MRECIPQKGGSIGEGSITHSLLVCVSCANTRQSEPALHGQLSGGCVVVGDVQLTLADIQGLLHEGSCR